MNAKSWPLLCMHTQIFMSEQCLLQVMERRQAAAEEAEEQGSEGSGRDTGLSHRSSSEPPVTMLVQKLQDQRL